MSSSKMWFQCDEVDRNHRQNYCSQQLMTTATIDVDQLVEKYRPYLKAIACRHFPAHLKSRLDDSDLVQEAMLRASKEIDQFRGTTEAELECWLRETLVNCITDSVRHHKRQMRSVLKEQHLPDHQVITTDPTPSEMVRTQESNKHVWQAVRRLPSDYQTVIELRQRLELSFVEIGERMQRSPDAVRMLWGRALVALGKELVGVN